MENSIKCYRIKVSGKVQGVWFRASTKRKAEELGVFGFVRNEQDGAVYIEAEGEAQQMNKFLQWCQEGPAFARVLSVDSEPIHPQGFQEFKILS